MVLLSLLLCSLLSTTSTRAFVAPPAATSRARLPPAAPPGLAVLPARLQIVFSDVDGSLVHYPARDDPGRDADPDNALLALPASATGLRGVISSRTLAACRDLRRDGVLLVLISGMRTSTLLGRLPYLPRADAYCTEAGGRIFYPTAIDGCCEGGEGDGTFRQATPLPFSGADPEADLTPFGLREDEEWRRRMEAPDAAGRDGYPGNDVQSDRCDALSDDEECQIDYDNPLGFPEPSQVIPIDDRREGALWNFAQKLQRDEGLVIDAKSYSACFRVNKKHQTTNGEGKGGAERFRALLDGTIALPPGLATSTNLGCIDVYPVASGKLHCCRYLAGAWGVDMAAAGACVCDDDNDMEMAVGCAHAFVPAVTSPSVAATMQRHPTRFTQTHREGLVEGTAATEAALRALRDGVASASADAERLRAVANDR